MPKFYRDELSRVEDIEALMTTARDLAVRFKGDELNEATASIQEALGTLRKPRSELITSRATSGSGLFDE